MRASTWDRRLESLWLARKRRSSNDILRNKIPYRFHPVSEFVFGTYDAAFVQAMYEDYLRDPASVGPEWRGCVGKGCHAGRPAFSNHSTPHNLRKEYESCLNRATPKNTYHAPLPIG